MTEHYELGEVLAAEALQGLIVRPRKPQEASRLLSSLIRVLPEAKLRRSASGIILDPLSSDELFRRRGALNLRWTPAAERYASNRLTARAGHERLFANVQRLKKEGVGHARELLRATDGVLDDHQVVNVAAMTLPGGFGLCLFDEQGAGKTVTQIYAFDCLMARDEIDFALIVAPKSMIAEWPRDFERFMGDLYKVQVVSGSRLDKLATLRKRADVLVTNFETAVSMEAELESLLRSKNGRAILVVDESFYVKSLDARRTRALRRLREWCGRAFVLCGTPAPNAPNDLVQQFSLVDFGLTFDRVILPQDREEVVEIVQAAIDERGLYLRNLKADVLPDLPTKRFHRLMIPLQPEQDRLYRAALGALVLDVKSTDETGFKRQLSSFFARRAALLQLCSTPASVARGYSETPAKLLALDSLLEELIKHRGEKVVLWSFYTDAIAMEMERYKKYGAVRYDGAVTEVGVRRAAVQAFQDDSETMLFIGNPAAAGAGLTLHRARYAVYESMSNQAAHYLQSLDRIHRRGQNREVEYFILLCENTLEITEYSRLIQKEKAAQSLLGDPKTFAVTRDTFLRDILAQSLR